MMNRFYKKPSPETMRKNRETYADAYKDEIKWFKENIQTLQKSKNKFMVDMYTVLITGSRKLTPKMESAIINSIIYQQAIITVTHLNGPVSRCTITMIPFYMSICNIITVRTGRIISTTFTTFIIN